MKKTIFMLLVLSCIGITAFANDDVMKISINGVVKQAKEIGTGKGVSFTLPDLTGNKFFISAIELAVFEKQFGELEWHIFKDSSGNESKKQLIDNPTSLNVQVDFGNISDYKDKAKYKIAYRYYVKSTDDLSNIIIAGQDIKDGWRLVGENYSNKATDDGFMFYKNTNPELSIDSISYTAETINGFDVFTYSIAEVSARWLPSNAFETGLKVDYTTSDYDKEDNLKVSYKLINAINNTIITESTMPSDNVIKCTTECEYVKVILMVTDNWGANTQTNELPLMIDKEKPHVVSEFNDMGRVLRGRNLYSQFIIIDSQNDALSSGEIYYTIRIDGITIYKNVKIPSNTDGKYTVDLNNMLDGEYEIQLDIFDKAFNKSTHILKQTLDNTPPAVSFLTPNEDENATPYNTWLNKSKKILLLASDEGAGINQCNIYMDGAYQGTSTVAVTKEPFVFRFNVTTYKTGKLQYYFYVFDDAVTINKALNTINTNSSGNYRFINNNVWLDKTAPTITVDSDEGFWYQSPKIVKANFYDYASTNGTNDSSGIKYKYYCITNNTECSNNWLTYPSDGVMFNEGGVYYLHLKAIDFAGNETVVSKKIKINTNAEVIGDIKPTHDYWHSIYYSQPKLYVVKNTSYNTKFYFTIRDLDKSDAILTEIKLLNQDNSSIYTNAKIDTVSNGNETRDIIFNLSYTNKDGSALPDGVYSLIYTITEQKKDGTILISHDNVKACEVVIKRNAPPTPIISVSNSKIALEYPTENLYGSINRADILSLYKKQYKAIKDDKSNIYKDYLNSFEVDNMVVTALYTDIAGNVSTATKRIFADVSENSEEILVQGNTVTVVEGRSANTYYIGIRRDKQSGINKSIFNFMK